jgi:transposase
LDEISKEISRSEKEKYHFTEWERQRDRVKERMEKLPEYVEKAASMIKRASTAGRPEKLNPAQKTMLFLFTRLMNKSNRDMKLVVGLLKPLLKEKVSYKYIERLYSDEEVMMVLHNLFVLLLKEENISGNLSGDGTGYSLMITKHYRSDPKKKRKGLQVCFQDDRLEYRNVCGLGLF